MLPLGVTWAGQQIPRQPHVCRLRIVKMISIYLIMAAEAVSIAPACCYLVTSQRSNDIQFVDKS
jgi:hypothetical protein